MTDSTNLMLDHITVWAENTDPRVRPCWPFLIPGCNVNGTQQGQMGAKLGRSIFGQADFRTEPIHVGSLCCGSPTTDRSSNITISNWLYQVRALHCDADMQGGDDLVALKGVSRVGDSAHDQNSSNILIENVTGYGGNGIAIGRYVYFRLVL